MIALSVGKKYAEMLSIGLSWRFSLKSGLGGLKGGGGIDPGNLSSELSRRFHSCDLCTKFDEDWTKIGHVDERTVRTDTHTDRHTDIHSSDFISVQCHELHWTDKNWAFLEESLLQCFFV